MKFTYESFFLYSLILLFPFSALAQCDKAEECNAPIYTAVPFLRIVPDARSGAMGDVGIGLSSDANAMHFNASKLAFVEDKGGVSLTYVPWLRSLALNDVYLTYLSAYYSPDDLQSFGLAIRYFSLGEINYTDLNGQPTGTGNPNEFEILASYSRKLSDKFALGIAPKFIFSSLGVGQTTGPIEISPGLAGAVDISGTYQSDISIGTKSAAIVLGGALSNLGSKISYTNSIDRDYLPANLGLGAAMDLNINEFNSITLACDINKLLVPSYSTDEYYRSSSSFEGLLKSFGDAPDGFAEEIREFSYSFGIEYLYNDQLALRCGYFTEYVKKGARKYYTVGLGTKYSIFGLNFSYLVPAGRSPGPLDNTLRFSLLFDFGSGAEG